MTYNFDEIIDRRETNAMNVEGYKGYLFGDADTSDLEDHDELIRMWVADMDFATPDVVLDAIKDRLDKKILGYTNLFGTDYYDAFVSWTERRFGYTFPQDHLVFSHGIVAGLIELVSYICDEDDKALILTPSYGPFKMACDKNHIETVYSPMINHNGYYEIDFEDVRKKVESENIKLCIFANPHNPTGRVWSEDELKQFGQIMADNDVWIISDEIHCDIKRAGQTHIPFAKAVPDYDKIVTAMSQSKAFNIAGLMFSNIIIPNRRLLKTWKLHHFSSENPLSIVATQTAYEKGEDWLAAMNDYLDDNFKYLANFLEQELPHAEFKIPEATYLAWVDLSYYIKEKEINEPIAKYFIKHAGVIIEGQEQFVHNAESHIRINIAIPREVMKKGLQKIKDALI
ncbi:MULTISPECIES: 3M3SH-releasing C-S lyase [Staphylococcus]|uniref:cysteine-S-conjugate beta-lyase n=1 Tax=Staphylococcus borealis TaxID=2742203 RepID=A0ABX2LPE7_9STAP|nr:MULTISPECIES: 3M3SH-releasing C-S lyase [Staphylococcus]OLF32630.1 aminotransferase [Staphylococcus aureus]MDO0993807.1 3M3SH-releasing C-S lyase [Staphylococcus borealis]MUN94346.1 aminotransferase class I/II-fold pyridoxal phosphate-dependent enzyme [Staphylococcus borealis]NUI79263.1 aminotransferase class I/II-fold pyridoxal phosphate-dependent enzyme [Staphylococcus borealis]NUI81772.1 aminotransferase class I/II-fold pyridoxal phosphate-dependent enzyme [Staphylococcus borealis]